MKNRRLTVVVGLVVMCTVVVSLYAIADGSKPGSAGAVGAACGQTAGGCAKMAKTGYAMKGGRGLSPAATRGYSGGVIKLRVGPCGTMVLAVLEQGLRPDGNASVRATLSSAAGKQAVTFKQVKPGVFRSGPGVAAAGKLDVLVSGGGGMSDRVTFDVAAPTGGPGAGCPMKGGCALMSGAGAACTPTAGGCSKMGQGGCATMGACKQTGAKTAACKCAVCKCSPCKCK